MDVRIVEIHAADSKKALNTEWFVLENTGDGPFTTANCSLALTRGSGKGRGSLGTFDPGFTMAPGEKVRVVTGNSGKKAHGKAPEEEGLENYYLFLGSPVLRGKGSVLVMVLRSLEICRAEFDPKEKSGIAAAAAEA